MRTFTLLLIAAAAHLSGCANLSEVAKFSHDASRVVGDTAWVSSYQEQLARKQLYRDANSGNAAAEKLAADKIGQDLRGIHSRLEEYLAGLAAQADPDLAKLLPPLGAGQQSISQHPTLGIDASVVNAFVDLGDIVYGGVTHFARQRQLKTAIRQSEPEVQKLIGSLKSASDVYDRSLASELAEARRLFKLDRFGDVGPARPALAAFGGVLLAEKERSIAAQRAEVLRHKLTLEQVAAGHSELHANVDRLQAKDVVKSLLDYRKRMRDIQRRLTAELAPLRN